MLKLDSPLKLDLAAIQSPNLCDRFEAEDLKRIGVECFNGYQRDEQSRAIWMKRNEAGMDLALQVQKDKNFPWPGCSNVAFPLVTIAAMQFHARAYPAIVGEDQLVKVPVFGPDPDGSKNERAERVSTHMSWQLRYQDKDWEEQTDKGIFNLSIVGTNFKKTYYSASCKCNDSDLVLAKDLVLNYWAKSVEECPRKTHKLPTFRNEVYENVMRGKWRDILDEPWYQGPPTPRLTTTQIHQDNRQGQQPPLTDDTTSLMFLEQHVNLDLDDDGYAEPYIVTFEQTSQCVVRIVCRFDREDAIERVVSGPNKGKIISICATEYFTQYTFIPSPDGGIYGIGFGVFLGPLNESVNSLVNMLLDSGTMQTTGGGFLGRGAKIRGGIYTVAPFEWKRVDSTGDDLRKSIFPLPVNQPSDVLFQLLSLLINYTSRVSGTTDITVGENPGQNTPAETSRTMVEMGQKIYTAIFKRIWKATASEFEKLYKLNGVFLPLDQPQVGGAIRADYLIKDNTVCPVADPNITSETARVQLAITLKQAATTTPGYNRDEVEKRFLKAIRCDGIETIFPGTQGAPPPEDPKLQVAKLKDAGDTQRLQLELQAKQQEFMARLDEERRINNAKILELSAKAEQEAAAAQTEQQFAQVALINAEIGHMRAQNEHLNTQIEHFLRMAEIQSRHHLGLKQVEKAAA
jgi:chaperonin GroES